MNYDVQFCLNFLLGIFRWSLSRNSCPELPIGYTRYLPSRCVANWPNIRPQTKMWAAGKSAAEFLAWSSKRGPKQGWLLQMYTFPHFFSLQWQSGNLVIKFMKCTSKLCTESFCYKKMALIHTVWNFWGTGIFPLRPNLYARLARNFP